jgi:3-mercaptopyruvate sulfurtransferase SseA
MRLLIQRLPSAQFFHHGEWLSNKGLAQSFPDTYTIKETCIQYGLQAVQLVVTFDDERPDLSLPLDI